jgi:hypothetical protein
MVINEDLERAIDDVVGIIEQALDGGASPRRRGSSVGEH